MTELASLDARSFPDKDTACFFLKTVADDKPLPNLADLTAAHQCEWARWFQQQELAPFVYHSFQRNNQQYTAEAKQILTQAYWETVANSTVQEKALVEILDHFEAKQIPVILLKGAALGVTVYPEMAARPMGDLDLWIEKKDLVMVWQIMHQLGYETDGLWSDPSDVPDHHTQVAFFPVNGRHSLVVEILWDLIMRPGFIGKFPLIAWWQRRQTFAGYGRQVTIMDPSAMLLHVCLHQMLQHRGELRLRWLLDVDRLVRGSDNYYLRPEDWHIITEESLAAGILPAVQAALATAVTYFGTPLPDEGKQLLKMTPPPDQWQQFQRASVPNRSTAGIVLTYFKEAQGWRQKTAVLSSRLFPSPTYMRQRYEITTNWVLPYYYGRRLLKGIWMALMKKRGVPK